MDLLINKYFKSFSLFVLIIFSTQSIAVSISDAITASENKNVTAAAKMWSQLANEGNTIAQYNLANYYSTGKGVQKSPQQASKWLKDAARSGFVQAYLDLNKNAIAPANGISLSFNIDPALWLSKQESKKYTIQLASSRYEKSIKKAYEDNNIKGKGGYYHYVRDGVNRYALIYGTFKTVAAAKDAMKDLPAKLRKKTPWVRKIKSLQKISK